MSRLRFPLVLVVLALLLAASSGGQILWGDYLVWGDQMIWGD
jgi:hypothetical protein